MADLLDLMNISSGETNRTLPWIPPPRDVPSVADVTALLTFALIATAIFAVSELAENRERRETVRRYFVRRHRIIRAPFYRTFVSA